VTLLERDFKEKPGGNQQSSEMADIIAMGLCLGWMDYSGEILSAVRFLSSKNCPSGVPSAAQKEEKPTRTPHEPHERAARTRTRKKRSNPHDVRFSFCLFLGWFFFYFYFQLPLLLLLILLLLLPFPQLQLFPSST